MLFEDLVKKNFVEAKYANYKNIIQDAVASKAKAEYRCAYFSKSEWNDIYSKAEKFIKMAKVIIC